MVKEAETMRRIRRNSMNYHVRRGLTAASMLRVIVILVLCSAACGDSMIQLEWATSTRIEIVLRWEDRSEWSPYSYELERSTSDTFANSVIIELPAEPNIYSDTGGTSERFRLRNTDLEIGQIYYYRIRARYG